MEGCTDQNLVPPHLSTRELYHNWGTHIFDNCTMMIDEEYTHTGAESVYMEVDQQLLDELESNSSRNSTELNVMNLIDEESNHAGAESVRFMHVQQLLDVLESNTNRNTELNAMNLIDEESANHAGEESDFMDVGQHELFDEKSINSSHNTEQDLTVDEFVIELTRLMILEEQRVILIPNF